VLIVKQLTEQKYDEEHFYLNFDLYEPAFFWTKPSNRRFVEIVQFTESGISNRKSETAS
jgi:hypothetical protein